MQGFVFNERAGIIHGLGEPLDLFADRAQCPAQHCAVGDIELLIQLAETLGRGATGRDAHQLGDQQGRADDLKRGLLRTEAATPRAQSVVEAVGAMGDPQRVDGIRAERMDERGDLRRVHLAVAGADCVDSIDRLGVAQQRAQFLEGFRGIPDHVDALAVFLPIRAAVLPGLGQGASPRVESGGLGGIGPDDGLDVEVVLETLQGRDEQRLRVGQAGQPQMCHPLRQPIAPGQFGAEVIVVAQGAHIQAGPVALFQRCQVIPPGLFRVSGQGGHPGEVQPIGRTTQLIAQLEQRLGQTLCLLEGEPTRLSVREQMGQGSPVAALQDFDPSQQRIRRLRRRKAIGVGQRFLVRPLSPCPLVNLSPILFTFAPFHRP